MSLKTLLQRTGLSRYQQILFTTILENPDLNAQKISRSSKVPIGRIYSELDILEQKKLITTSSKRPKTYFIPKPRETILQLLEDEKEKLEQIEKEAFDELGKSNQVAEIFHTKPEIKQSQIESFKWAKEEVCQCLGTMHKPTEHKDLKSIYEKEISSAIERGVKFKAIYQKNQTPPKTLLEFHKKYPEQFKIRFADFPIPRFDIVDSNQILFKIQDPMDTTTTIGTTIITNYTFAKKLRTKFMNLWQESSPLQGK